MSATFPPYLVDPSLVDPSLVDAGSAWGELAAPVRMGR
jgi:hypothetical protein